MTEEKPASAAMSASMVHSLGSPSMQATKRRRTTTAGAGETSSPLKRVKRTSTYSAKDRTVASPEDGFRSSAQRQKNAVMTSQSARFSEHSGLNSSIGLPGGSIQADFVNHEPNVMFPETGSTIADNESSQQRLIEQALASKKGSSTSMIKLVDSDDPKSSSFPWSASNERATQGAKLELGPDQRSQPAQLSKVGTQTGSQVHIEDSVRAPRGETVTSQQAEYHSDPDGEAVHGTAKQHLAISDAILDKQAKPKSSPQVQIPPQAANDSPQPQRPATAEKTTRARKRKVPEVASDLPNSDDIAVGLPKERYEPRPSRRRATQIAEEPIDYSVRPERAAKIKRTKTTADANMSQSLSVGDTNQSPLPRARRKKEDTAIVDTVDPKLTEQPASAEACLKATSKLSPIVDAAAEQDDCIDVGPAVQKLSVTAETKRDETILVSKMLDDEAFVKPTPKAKSTSKVKRSHTTIFEDHVDFAGARRTPTLSQQQAKRKSVLAEVQTQATQRPQPKRRTVIDDDEDEAEDTIHIPTPKLKVDHDETDKGTFHETKTDAQPPQKRGRGREQYKAKSEEKVVDSSEAEEDDQDDAEEVPKKRGRGRLRKTAAAAAPADEPEPDKAAAAAAVIENPKVPQDNDRNGDGANEGGTTKQAAPNTQEPTPSPEKPAKPDAALPPQKSTTKASPTLHSPIKKSSKVLYRVGLSKRDRIPSLHQTLKPPR